MLHSSGVVAFPITQHATEKIGAIVANVVGSSYGVVHYKTVEEKIVAYLWFLINDHPFTDGNKRMAVLVFLILCRRHGVSHHLVGYDLDALAVFLQKKQNLHHQEVIRIVARSIFTPNT